MGPHLGDARHIFIALRPPRHRALLSVCAWGHLAVHIMDVVDAITTEVMPVNQPTMYTMISLCTLREIEAAALSWCHANWDEAARTITLT